MIPTIIAMGNVYFFTVLKVIGITLRFRVGKINLNNLHTMHKIQFFVKNIEKSSKNLVNTTKSTTFAFQISRSRAVVACQAHNLKVVGSNPASATQPSVNLGDRRYERLSYLFVLRNNHKNNINLPFLYYSQIREYDYTRIFSYLCRLFTK